MIIRYIYIYLERERSVMLIHNDPSLSNVGIAMPKTTLIFVFWNPTLENDDEWGMVYYCYTIIKS